MSPRMGTAPPPSGVFLDFSAEGVFGLEAGEEDGVFGVGDVVLEVVEDAAGFAHAAGGDDEERVVAGVEGAALIG